MIGKLQGDLKNNKEKVIKKRKYIEEKKSEIKNIEKELINQKQKQNAILLDKSSKNVANNIKLETVILKEEMEEKANVF